MNIYVEDELVGSVEGAEFSKSIHGSKYFIGAVPAIPLYLTGLGKAKEVGATIILVHDKDTGIIYEQSIDIALRFGIIVNQSPEELQIALPLAYWDTIVPY